MAQTFKVLGMTFQMADDETQLRNNLNDILGGYENGMNDFPDEYPEMTLEEAINYCVPAIYDQYSDGDGFTGYKEGICEHLKFLGNERINAMIEEIANECGILKDTLMEERG